MSVDQEKGVLTALLNRLEPTIEDDRQKDIVTHVVYFDDAGELNANEVTEPLFNKQLKTAKDAMHLTLM